MKFGNEVETATEPIKDQASGNAHFIRVDLPNGMEYKHPEIATTGILKSTRALAFDCSVAHSSLAIVEQTHTVLVV